jgi:cation:H+ antiporter
VKRMIEIVSNSVLLAFSLGALAIASQFVIKSIEDLIELTRLSEVSAGFAILSVMTSLPEIFVALFSVVNGKPGFSVGDILGSNVFNIGIVIGILATFGSLKKCCSETLTELVDILFLSSIIPLVLVMFRSASSYTGLALLGVFAFSMYQMTRKREQPIVMTGSTTEKKPEKKMIVLRIVLGVALVVGAAELIILAASNIASALGAPPILIGAKIIAIGTSLPELFLDLTAVRRGRVNLAIGDIIGSNLTNISLVLGLVLVASPFGAVDLTVLAEILPFVLITTLIVWRYLTKGGISQVGGIALIITYTVFQATIIV